MRERLSQCLRQTGRSGSKHCLANHLGLIDELPIMLESTSTRPTITSTTHNTISTHSTPLQFEKIRIDLADLTQQVETLKTRNRELSDLERSLERLNMTAHQIKQNLSVLFDLYETEYDSNLRLQQHLNELFSNYAATNTANTKGMLKDLDNVTVTSENSLESNGDGISFFNFYTLKIPLKLIFLI
jgi:septation ring formation regulator EzrA